MIRQICTWVCGKNEYTCNGFHMSIKIFCYVKADNNYLNFRKLNVIEYYLFVIVLLFNYCMKIVIYIYIKQYCFFVWRLILKFHGWSKVVYLYIEKLVCFTMVMCACMSFFLDSEWSESLDGFTMIFIFNFFFWNPLFGTFIFVLKFHPPTF